MWYVEEFLAPSLLAMGVGEKQIKIWNDAEGKGNLLSCMEAFRLCGNYDGDTWHIQDDVLLCRDFTGRAEALAEKDGILCGYGCRNFETYPMQEGPVTPNWMWYSFPCIRIPDGLAGACADWFFRDAGRREQFRSWVERCKGDDWLFKSFLMERHPGYPVWNLLPNLAEHVDDLIGGTVVNPMRRSRVNRAIGFPDPELVTELEKTLKSR